MLFALLVPDAHAFTFHDDARIGCLIRFMLAQMVPDVGAIRLYDAGNVIFVKCTVHGGDLSIG